MKVIKRNGEEAEFCKEKIVSAITRASNEVREVNPEAAVAKDTISMIANRLYERCRKRTRSTSVEEIQDMVEKELMKEGAYDVAKKYILYREQRKKIRDTSHTLLDYKKTVDNYLNVNDWRVKENSTVTYSVGGLILSNSGAITANYWLSEIYDKEIADAHKNADIHLHDLSMLTGYCAGWSLKQLIQEGLGGVSGKITSSPASHLSTLCNQMVNFLGIMQNEWAG